MSQIKRGELNATTQRRKVPTVTRDQIQDNASAVYNESISNLMNEDILQSRLNFDAQVLLSFSTPEKDSLLYKLIKAILPSAQRGTGVKEAFCFCRVPEIHGHIPDPNSYSDPLKRISFILMHPVLKYTPDSDSEPDLPGKNSIVSVAFDNFSYRSGKITNVIYAAQQEDYTLLDSTAGGSRAAHLSGPTVSSVTSLEPGVSPANKIIEYEEAIEANFSALWVSDEISNIKSRVDGEATLWSGKQTNSSGMRSVLNKYFNDSSAPKFGTGFITTGDPKTWTAWSAAFISWILKEAGQFPGSSAHWRYCKTALENRQTGGGPWRLFSLRREKVVLQVGDVLVRPRPGEPTFSHGDVVYLVKDGIAYLAGGNLSSTVQIDIKMPLNIDGTPVSPGRYLVVLKKNPRDAEATSSTAPPPTSTTTPPPPPAPITSPPTSSVDPPPTSSTTSS